MDDYLNVLAAWITIFSIALTVVAAVAYSRVRNTRVLLVAIAFALFAVQGVVLTLSSTPGVLESVEIVESPENKTRIEFRNTEINVPFPEGQFRNAP